MRIEKKTLNDALRVLGKVVCQTSPVELYRSVRFVGDENGIRTMATDGVETILVEVDAFTESEIDFCVPFKELKDLVRIGRSVEVTTSSDDLSYFLLVWNIVTILQHFLFCKWQGIQECLHRRFPIAILPAVRT